MNRLLKIAVTVDPEIPVPPKLYGGIERIVDMLVRELQRRGHEVHVFANPESTVETNLAPYPAGSSISPKDTLKNMLHVRNYLRQNGPFDVVHSFARLAYLLPFMLSDLPKVQSYQRIIAPRSIMLGSFLAGKSLYFTTCSGSNAKPVRNLGGQWEIIYNGVDLGKYTYVPYVHDSAPLIFLGRVERFKGAHIAIEVAKKTGQRLIIAGNHSTSGEEAEYFYREIEPLCDGHEITYFGPVNDQQKNELLGNAKALLFPIDLEEPFGIVMIEALACGTPVIGFKRGSVSEVVRNGETGFICDTTAEMIAAVNRINSLERSSCRKDVEMRFSQHVIVSQYERLYYSILKN